MSSFRTTRDDNTTEGHNNLSSQPRPSVLQMSVNVIFCRNQTINHVNFIGYLEKYAKVSNFHSFKYSKTH